jgi:hypothetical protein
MNSPLRILPKFALAAAVAVSSLTAVVGTQDPASAQVYIHAGYGHPGYGHPGYGPYRWHGRYWHHRRWHPAYYGPHHVYHAGFWVYF